MTMYHEFNYQGIWIILETYEPFYSVQFSSLGGSMETRHAVVRQNPEWSPALLHQILQYLQMTLLSD